MPGGTAMCHDAQAAEPCPGRRSAVQQDKKASVCAICVWLVAALSSNLKQG